MPELGGGGIPSCEPEVVVGVPAELLRRRPDVRRAERQVAAQSAQIGVAAADLFPTFTINGQINWQATQFPQLFSAAANGGFINPAFNWNILNYGRLVNRVGVQEARFQQLAVQYQETVLQANAEIENAIITFLRKQEETNFLARTVASTEESVRLARIQYNEGLTDFDRVNNLERQLAESQDTLATAETEVALALVGIYRTLGGGWQLRLGFAPQVPVEADEPIPNEAEAPMPPAVDDQGNG
jgi:outer membrane protein TolC